jgi:exportin-2 (importin alpha re-exporter)
VTGWHTLRTCILLTLLLTPQDGSGAHMLDERERAMIKPALIELMLTSRPAMHAQLLEAVRVIADYDFWERWDTLVGDLTSHLSLNDPQTTYNVLDVAHSIFVRWRPLVQREGLLREVKHVLDTFSEPFLRLLMVSRISCSCCPSRAALPYSQILTIVINSI